MTNFNLMLCGIFGILALCEIIEVIKVWREVEEDEAKGY